MRTISKNSIMGRVADIVREHPGCDFILAVKTAKELYGYPKHYISAALNSLYKRGAVKREGRVKHYRYYFITLEPKRTVHNRSDVTPEYLREHFSYDHLSGNITRKKSRFKSKVGSNPCRERCGYWSIPVKGYYFLAHRVAWAIYHGSWPERLIDHINGVKKDNRLCNLREATHAQNIYNNHSMVKSKTGFRGVSHTKNKKKFIARIKVNRKLIVLGVFNSSEEAYERYKEEAKKIRGEFYREPNL